MTTAHYEPMRVCIGVVSREVWWVEDPSYRTACLVLALPDGGEEEVDDGADVPLTEAIAAARGAFGAAYREDPDAAWAIGASVEAATEAAREAGREAARQCSGPDLARGLRDLVAWWAGDLDGGCWTPTLAVIGEDSAEASWLAGIEEIAEERAEEISEARSEKAAEEEEADDFPPPSAADAAEAFWANVFNDRR